MSAAGRIVSTYTKSVAIAGAIILVAFALAVARVPDPTARSYLPDWGTTVMGFVTAGFILRTALMYKPGEKPRRQWILIGTAVVLWSFGDGIYALIESLAHDLPAMPGPQDVFYVAGYVVILIALLMIAYSYRRLVDMRWPVFVAGGITAAMVGVLWLGVLRPSLETTSNFAQRVILASYPLAVTVLALGPVILVLVTITRLGTGRLAWPWWFGAAGAGTVAISEAAYSYLNFHTGYTSGSIIDYGWMLGYLLILIATLLERDVQTLSRTS